MRSDLVQAIRAEARPLLEEARDRRIVVWGAGELGSWLMGELGERGVAFVDANPIKHRSRIAGREVHPLSSLGSLDWDEVWISVLSDVQGIVDELRAAGYVEGEHFKRPFPSGKRRQVLDALPRTLSFLDRFDVRDRDVLEVGFGGQLFHALTLLHRGARRVVVSDVSPQSTALTSRRDEWLGFLEALGAAHGPLPAPPGVLLQRIEIHPEPVTACALPFADGAFDLVTNTGVMEHVDDPEAAIAEFGRVLKDDGLALCCAIGIHDHRSNDPSASFTPWSFLEYTDAEWESFDANAYHQNRWRAVDFERAFARHGFDVVASDSVADRRLTSGEVRGFAERFRTDYSLKQLSELDLFLAARRCAATD